jgi:hypothetical protein
MTPLRYQSWCLQTGLCPSIHIKTFRRSKDTLIQWRIGCDLATRTIHSQEIMDPRRCFIIPCPLPLRNPKTLAYPIFLVSVFQYYRCHQSSCGTQIARYMGTLHTIIRLRYSRKCADIAALQESILPMEIAGGMALNAGSYSLDFIDPLCAVRGNWFQLLV